MLYIYKPTELASTSTAVSNPKKRNVIVGCIYSHPNMDFSNLQDKLSKKNKTVFPLGDFDTDLLKYEHHSSTTEFLNSFSSYMLLPHIIQPK